MRGKIMKQFVCICLAISMILTSNSVVLAVSVSDNIDDENIVMEEIAMSDLSSEVQAESTEAPEPEAEDSEASEPGTEDLGTTISMLAEVPTEIVLSAEKNMIGIGDTTTLKVECSVSDQELTDVVYESLNPEIAAVDSETGTVTGIGAGTATITVKAAIGGDTYSEVIDIEVLPVVYYSGHVQNIGWQNAVKSNQENVFAGTEGQILRMEALRIDSVGLTGIEYSGHVQNIGWQNFVNADGTQIAGTTGRSLQLEAIKIRLTGESAEKYDIYYRTHVAYTGWLGWAKNGAPAGNQGFGKSIEALQIMILPKDSDNAPDMNDSFRQRFYIIHDTHVAYVGWQGIVEAGNQAGVIGRNLEGICISPSGAYDIGIKYRAHVSYVGWQDYRPSGEIAGTVGQSKPIEAIEIELTGDNKDMYDVYYRVYVANVGWLDWAKNGQSAGSVGFSAPIQGVQIATRAAGESAPGSTACPFLQPVSVEYSTYTQNSGWSSAVRDGSVSGKTGSGAGLEAFVANVSGVEGLGIEYNAHVAYVGWQGYTSAQAGVMNSARNRIEAMQIRLTGALSKYYDVWYRLYVPKFGWLGWAKNGQSAGTSTLSLAAEAIQVVVQPKAMVAPGSTEHAYIENQEGWVYIGGYRRYRDAYGTVLNDVSHVFNPSSKRITVDCNRGIVTIYGYNSTNGTYDTPIKAFWCSVGRVGSDQTPSGSYSIYRKYSSKIMNASDGSYSVWAPYISCFNGSIYFHGVASVDNQPRSLISRENWEALGTPKSSGCVRLAGIEAKWLYENCSIGTPVSVGSYGSAMACPISNPIRYPWVGGATAPDPTL